MRFHASLTAEAVCFMRATETSRREPILEDDLARRFLSPPLRALARTGLGSRGRLHNFVVGRHRFIDDGVAQGPKEGQVVIVGAGYDTRPWRLGLDRCFVVDHPHTLKRRIRKGPAGDGVHVAVDLAASPLGPALDAAGHDPRRPTAWIWEGVSMYLPQAAVRDTLNVFAARSTAESSLLVDFWHPVDGEAWGDGIVRLSAHALQLVGEPIRYGLHPGDVGAVLGRHGFEVVEHGTPRWLAARFGRRFDPAMHVVHARFTAEKLAATSVRSHSTT